MLRLTAATLLLLTSIAIGFDIGFDDCTGKQFADFANGKGFVPDTDPPIPYQFNIMIKGDLPKDDETFTHGTAFKVFCPERMDFAYVWSSKSLICDDGEVVQDDVSKYNHCISYDKCSAALFDRDWTIEGYRLDSSIDRLLDNGPIIAQSLPMPMSAEASLKEWGKKSANQIKSLYAQQKNNLLYTNYPPLLLLTCDTIYTKFALNPDQYSPHTYCQNKPKWKRAKWGSASSLRFWTTLHSSCKLIGKLSIKKSPPPQGCTVLSDKRSECTAYKKYCAWDEFQKYKVHFAVDIRVCSKQCAPWSCYAALTMPVECSKALTRLQCTKQIPMFMYWCEWDREESLCETKKLGVESKDYLIEIDICSTDNAFCRASQDEEYWLKEDVSFRGAIKDLNQIRFGYEYKIFGVRHVIPHLSDLSKMRGSVLTHIRATHEMNDADPTEATLDAAVIIEPDTVTRKFGVLTRKKFQVLSKLFNLKNSKKRTRNKKKPSPKYNYVSIELKSDGLETPVPPISFWLSTYTSNDCKRCKLDKFPKTAIGSRVKTVTNVLYVIDVANTYPTATIQLQFPNMNKAKVKLKMKATSEPAPERCGKNDLGCFVILEPIMNDAFASLFEFKCSLPIRARLAGYDDSVLTIFGVEPSKRSKASTKYSIKVAKAAEFAEFEGQKATLRWSVDMGLVKAISIIASNLAEYSNTVQKPIKIEFYQFDELETRPDKTKWILLTAKKTMPIACTIQYHCNLCGVQIKPEKIRIRKGFKRLRLRVTARIPGDFQIHFTVTGAAADLIADPPSLLMEVFQPNAGFVKVPETLGPIINGEWSEEFDVSVTRPPFRTELKLKPLTNEFVTKPLEIRFDNIKTTMIQETANTLSKFGIVNDESIKIMPSLECGGGPPRELRWTLSGAIEEFYQPHSTYVTVETADTDDDYCKYKQYEALMNASNGTGMSFEFVDKQTFGEIDEKSEDIIPIWTFEYYLIGGAITICILVVVNQFKEQKFDRMIAIMSGALQT